jgi:hypothetical protein
VRARFQLNLVRTVTFGVRTVTFGVRTVTFGVLA